jgi:hypothetical protein
MALFTDQDVATIGDLKRYESAVLDLASSEGVDLSTKLHLAHIEVGLKVAGFVQDNVTRLRCPDDPLNGVVVTDPLRHWSILHALSVLYRDLYSNQLNDRYLAKWQQYEKLAEAARSLFFEYGIGLATTPISRAGRPSLFMEASSTALPLTYYVATSWVGDQAAEGMGSDMVTADLEAGKTIRVEAGSPVPNAHSWNIYVGTSPFTLSLQNSTPLSPTSSWMLPVGGLISGRAPSQGQAADYIVRQRRLLRRG